ncbi:hypothetical protein K440DRAFT_639900 [Wilcoxina mikolae CBS 423.85]|nr:hypothetical protein K440DRAFT_639900 [Wilcoxina mikolae CBS 423.85]
MAALEPSPPPPLHHLNRSTTPTTTITVAAPSSPSLVLREILSPSNSPASPSISAKLPLSPPVVASSSSRALSVPASPPPTTTPTAATAPSASTPAIAAMNATLAAPTPAAANSNNGATPPTKKVLERNQACLGCRQRKRKCDGGKPNCGACERLERQCVYTHNAVTKIHSSSHYRDHHHPSLSSSNTRPSVGPRPSSSHDSPSIAPCGNSSTPSLVVPNINRPSSSTITGGSGGGGGPGGGFTPVNAEVGGVRSARPSPPSTATTRLSPNLANGINVYSNPRKRSFSSLESSPATGVHHVGNSNSNSHPVEYDATFAVHFLQASQFAGLGHIDIPGLSPEDSVAPEDMPELTDDALPPEALMQELFNLFLEKWHSILPCLYKKRVLADIIPGGPLTQPNTLTFAILALAGYLHPNPGVKAASHKWALLGKECFDRSVLEGRFSMQAVQGGIYLCLRMFGLAQMSQMWIFLGSVWRMCLPLGFHHIDSNTFSYHRGFLPEPRSELEIEERRRTVWAVYILDRLASISVPWTMCVVDSEFCVNFPVSEEVFQNGSMENVEHMIIDPFPNTLDSLLPPTMTTAHASNARDAYQHLCKLAVLLGRILSYTRSTRSSEEFDNLDVTLTRFLFNIPKPYRSMIGVSSAELPTVLLLGCIMHACTIFLHSGDGGGDGAERSVKAVENILTLLKNVSSSIDPNDDRVLGNPLLGPTLLLAARILCERYLEEGGSAGGGATFSKVEVLLGTLGRMEEGWPRLAGLMRSMIFEDLRRNIGVIG